MCAEGKFKVHPGDQLALCVTCPAYANSTSDRIGCNCNEQVRDEHFKYVNM